MDIENKENMEKTEKGNGVGNGVRLFFSRIFVLVMLIAVGAVTVNGTFLLAQTASRQWLEYYGVFQSKEETKEYLIDMAEQMIGAAVELASDGEAKKTGVSEGKLGYETYYYYEGDELKAVQEPSGGIYGCVITRGRYFEKSLNSINVKKYDGEYGIGLEDMKENKENAMFFWYEDGRSYIQYEDGTVEESEDKEHLTQIDTDISKMITTLSYEDIAVCISVNKEWLLDRNRVNTYLEINQYGSLEEIVWLCGLGLGSFLIALILTVRTKRELQKNRKVITEIPVIFIIASVFAVCAMVDFVYDRFEVLNDWILALIVFLSVVIIYIVYRCVRELILKIRERSFFKDLFAVRFCRWIWHKVERGKYKELTLSRKLWLKRIIFIVVSAFMMLSWPVFEIMGNRIIYYLMLMVYLLGTIIYHFYELKLLRGLNDMYKQVEEIYKGNYVVRDVEENDILYDITDKLNELSNGMEEAVEKRISSEKMKVELITNVSHDLKTPLTSIISYVDLLKEEEMTDVAAAYVKILEEKSYQLKNIVSDVFDLAKANSGQDVEIENIDGIMLVHQVLADMQDLIEKSGRVIKTDITPESYFIQGDGKKLYRALQNLIDNALKYSMEGTRIYLRTDVLEDRLVMEIKNIASYEMEFTGDNIVERFVRGDESRTTEGNGLGLSIAKSFIEVSGGNMVVLVDGDVFKVIVEF